MRIFHFSDDPAIVAFVPRTLAHRPEVEPLVWAVDQEHAGAYLFPRDCPRVLLWLTPETTAADRERCWGERPHTKMIAHAEWSWYQRLSNSPIYRYELPSATFAPLSEDNWMWVSRETVIPAAMEPIFDILAAMAEQRIELRLMPSLAPLWGAWQSTMHFSGIRLGNSTTWPRVDETVARVGGELDPGGVISGTATTS